MIRSRLSALAEGWRSAHQKRLLEAIRSHDTLPEHVAIIMDGNGRWALRHGRAREYGHKRGIESVRDIAEGCAELGISYLTLYTFSTENWHRPEEEVNAIMELLVQTIRSETKTLTENNIRLNAIGDLDLLPERCRVELLDAIEITSGNTSMTLTLALSYSGRWEITDAARHIAADCRAGRIDPGEIDEQLVSSYLHTADMPDPDILIRTGGDLRVSNFLLWQIAYSEIFVTRLHWPDFRRRHLYNVVRRYLDRERRFGRLLGTLRRHETAPAAQ
jgi:undecaprenyl diphosphate synthase